MDSCGCYTSRKVDKTAPKQSFFGIAKGFDVFCSTFERFVQKTQNLFFWKIIIFNLQYILNNHQLF